MHTVLWVVRKELWETLRDPLVLTISLGFPILFFPMVVLLGFQLAMLDEGIAEKQPPRVAIEGVDDQGPAGMVDILMEPPIESASGTREAVRAGDLDAFVSISRDGDAIAARVVHDSTRPRSSRARDLIEERLDTVRDARTREIALQSGIEPDTLMPWSIEVDHVVPTEQRRAKILALTLPMIVVLSLMMSTTSPAVDIMVGERERGTLETTLIAASRRVHLAAGKVAAIVVIGVIATVGNAVAVGLTLLQILATVDSEDVGTLALSLPSLSLAVPVLITLALFLASGLAMIVLPAQNFKEGQSRSSLVLLVVLGLTVFSQSAEADLTLWGAAIPIFGTVTVLRAAIEGSLTLLPTLCACASNLVLSTGLLVWGARILRDEAFLFGPSTQQSMWARWFSSGETTSQ